MTISRNQHDASDPSVECLERRRAGLVLRLRSKGFTFEDAEDAAQETIIQGWLKIENDTVSDIKNRGAWIHLRGYQKALRIWRRRRTSELTEVLEPFSGALGDWRRLRQEEAMYSILSDALHQLPEHLLEVLIFCCICRHTYAEASRVFGVSKGTINRRLAEARELLASTLR